MQIAIVPAGAEDRPVVAQLAQLCARDSALHNDPTGPQDLHRYWTLPGHQAFLIRADTKTAGFLLVGRHSRLSPDFDGRSVDALFVVPVLRRQGIASAAAAALFAQLPGSWEIATYGPNVAGQAFWRSVADRYTGGAYVERWIVDGAWRGPVHRFSAPPRAS